MKIGIHLNCCVGNVPIEEQIRLMKENGFATTFCMADIENVDEVIETVQKAGIEFENLHAPFRKINAMWEEDEVAAQEALNELFAGIDTCAHHGIPVLVVHVAVSNPPAIVTDKGFERYDKLMEYAREKGVTIAYENTRAVGKLITIVERYEDAGFCWDVGHESVMTRGITYMPFLDAKLVALHLHDNMAQFGKDWHMIPFDGVANMENAAKQLADCGYEKSIMLESIQRSYVKYADYTPEQFYKCAGEAAKKFANMVEAYKANKIADSK